MTNTDHLERAAIAALTEIARGTRTQGAGTPQEREVPTDFAEIACYVITAVAANVGGAEALLSGRPGSTEAEHVRQILMATTGGDHDRLMSFRTEALRHG